MDEEEANGVKRGNLEQFCADINDNEPNLVANDDNILIGYAKMHQTVYFVI